MLAGRGRIGPYEPLAVLGEGGFGVVYLAEQRRPIQRRVALKLIKPGMDTKQVIARFATERQTLAFMDHPGIAQVFDAGETEAGVPTSSWSTFPASRSRATAIRNDSESGIDSNSRFAQAESLQTQVLRIRLRTDGEDGPNTLSILNNLANTLSSQGHLARVHVMFERALEGKRRVLGPEHPSTLNSLDGLASLCDSDGNYAAFRMSTQDTSRSLAPEDARTRARNAKVTTTCRKADTPAGTGTPRETGSHLHE